MTPQKRDHMRSISKLALRLVVCIAAVLAVTVVLYVVSFRDRPFAAGLFFIFLVLIVSAVWGLRYAIFISFLAALAFSWLALPLGRFHISDPRDIFALVAFLFAGILTSYLSDRARKEALNANQRRAEAVAAQQRFADLVNSVEGIVREADAETFGFSFVSQQAERILGYPVQLWLQEPTFWKDHIHPEDRHWAVEFCQQATAEKRSHDFEYRMIAADGRVVWMRDLVTVVVENGRATRLRGVMVDITQRKRDEAALREQASLLNLTHDSIFVRDMNDVLTYWNRGAEEFYGWTAKEAIGKVSHGLMQTIFPAPLDDIQAELVRNGRWEGELVHTKKFGTRVTVASRWSLQRDDKGMPIAILETNNDITERRRAEQAREEIEEQWRAAFESNPTMYFMVDAAGTIVLVNAFGAQQLGYSISELVGQPVASVFYEPDRDAVQKRANACFEQPGRTMRWEARKIRKDGTMLWVRETANAVYLKKRPVLLVVCEDITEQKRAEEAARRSEKELRDVIETIPATAWSALPDGSNAFVNSRWIEYTGLSAERTTGSGWQAAVHPEDVRRHAGKRRASVAAGEPFEDEVRFRRADGEYRWHLVRGVPLRDEQGNILKWYGTLTDIEDRKRAEALLAGEKRILEMVAKGDSLPEILESLCRMVEEQARGVLASILLLDGNRLRHGGAPSLPKAYTDAIDGAVIGPSVGSCGTAAYRGQQVIVKDIATDPLWADYREVALPHSLRACWSTPVFSSQGKVIATFAMYYREPRIPSQRDHEIIEQITHLAGVAIERKLIQERLQRSESYLAEAQRLSHTGSWANTPLADKLLYWSEETFRIFGFDPRKGLPSAEAFWQRIHLEDRERAYQRRQKALREKTDYNSDFRVVLPDGAVRHIEETGHPVLNAAGEIVEFVGAAIEVTERKRAEQERERLRQLEADLAHLNRVSMMGELAASLAHEIKQPIAAAITNANTCLRWLKRDQPDVQEACEAASRIVKDAIRAVEIISRTSSLYKKGAPQRELVDVNEVIREMIVLLRNEATRYSISILPELAEGLPGVMADRVQLQQVFMNLMLNAIEAMRDTAGELRIKPQLDPEGQLLISVSDTGVGLPAEKPDQIFDAFFTTKPQGTGMGLAITRSIIESHGGRLWATANGERGATFHFTLPREMGAHA